MRQTKDEFQHRKLIANELFELRSDDRPKLRDFQMKKMANVRLEGDELQIDFSEDWAKKAPGIYAFVASNRVVKVGSASTGVIERLCDYPRHINKALTNAGLDAPTPHLKTPTPVWEANLWKFIYGSLSQGAGEIWARESKPVDSAIGQVSARMGCKVEESLVADEFFAPGLKQPVLNRSSRIM